MKNPFDFFDAIYCIHCERYPKRRKRARREFAKLGILDRVEWFSAAENDKKNGMVNPQGAERHRATGLCHLAIFEDAKQRGLRNVLIFEDDVIFLHKKLDDLASALEQLNANGRWGIFYLGMNVVGEELTRVSENLLFARKGAPHQIQSTHAYAINSSVFDEVMKWGSENSPPNIDVWIPLNFDCYCLYPLFSVQEQGGKAKRFRENFTERFEGQAQGGVLLSKMCDGIRKVLSFK